MARGAGMSYILPIIPPMLMVALAICIIANSERRLGEKQRKWEVRRGGGTRSACARGTSTLNFAYIIMALCRHVTLKTGN